MRKLTDRLIKEVGGLHKDYGYKVKSVNTECKNPKQQGEKVNVQRT